MNRKTTLKINTIIASIIHSSRRYYKLVEKPLFVVAMLIKIILCDGFVLLFTLSIIWHQVFLLFINSRAFLKRFFNNNVIFTLSRLTKGFINFLNSCLYLLTCIDRIILKLTRFFLFVAFKQDSLRLNFHIHIIILVL